jgi:hypothetical protein
MTNSNDDDDDNDDDTWIDDALERRIGLPALLALTDVAFVGPVTRKLADALRVRRHSMLLAGPGQGMPHVMPPLIAINPGPVYDPDAMERAYARQHEQSLARMLVEAWAVLSCCDAADIERHANDWARIQLLGSCVIVAPAALLDRWPHAGRRVAMNST